ncbi:MAG: guanylate kinase [Peptoniphilaceae bacterium]|nr:guanylate kinase [Peptoniphilaceae bacterium]MDY6085596.1 guanylate kinase [Peptoniphilaceae bacterium]
MRREGHLIIISGPSGVGKGTVCTALKAMRPELKVSISATTRKKRPTEVDGENYFFYDENGFYELIQQGELIEYAKVHGNYYGTPKAYVMDQLDAGEDVILEIDVQGAMQVKQNMPGGIYIFLLPPHKNDLEARIRNRGTEDEANIELRLHNAQEEISMLHDYDYAVINEDVDECATLVSHIIDAENQRIDARLMRKYWEEFHD